MSTLGPHVKPPDMPIQPGSDEHQFDANMHTDVVNIMYNIVNVHTDVVTIGRKVWGDAHGCSYDWKKGVG